MNTTLPVFYSFRRCPYAMRARMALAASQTAVRLREVILRDKPDGMIALSPKATIPVLVDGDDVLDESLTIMRWALSKNDPEGWLARRAAAEEPTTSSDFVLSSGDMGAADSALIAENDGPFKHHLDRYKYATRYDDVDPETHRAAGLVFLERLEKQLCKKQFLFAHKRTLADIAIFPFVRQFRIADEKWFDAAPIPHVRRWLGGLVSAPLFTSVMKKYPAWKDTGEEFLFP